MAFLDYDGVKILVNEIKKYMSDMLPSIGVDGSLSTTSTNAVQNKVITSALSDKADNIQTFTESSKRENISSGESISTVFGKIAKWFSDLKTVAFSGDYNDLSNKPTIPTNVSELTNDSKYITAAETEDLQTEVERLQDMIYTGVARVYLVTDDGSNISTDSGESLESWQSVVITYPD